jgi:hypothetical protein
VVSGCPFSRRGHRPQLDTVLLVSRKLVRCFSRARWICRKEASPSAAHKDRLRRGEVCESVTGGTAASSALPAGAR